MKLSCALALCLSLSAVALAQSKQETLERVAELEFGGGEKVVTYRHVTRENKLLLLGAKNARVLDLAGAQFVESHALRVPEYNEDGGRVISPDGRRVFVYGNYDSRKKEKVERPPSVWDLRTGEQVAVFDKTRKPVRRAEWSRNGRTLATSSDKHGLYGIDSDSVEVSFWDGETFEYKGTLPSDKLSWARMTADGETCFFAVGSPRNLWLLGKWVADKGGPLVVWDIEARKISQTVSADSDGVGRKISTYRFTPDERFLLVLAKPPKARDAERRVVVWEVEKRGAPGVELTRRYEIKPSPKISEWGAIPDNTGKLFTIHAAKNLQLYETATGEKKYELVNVETPTGWLNDRIFYGERFTTLTAYEASTGKELYRQKVVYDTHTEDSGYSSSDTGYTGPGLTVVDDYTRIVPHRGGRVFMTWSAKYVEVFDSSTGELLQRLVEPRVDNTGKKPKLSGKWLVSDAGWSEDGRTLYVIDDDRKKISLWRLAGS